MQTRRRARTDESLTDADRYILSRSIEVCGLVALTEGGSGTWVAAIPELESFELASRIGTIRFVVESTTPELPRWLQPTLRSIANLLDLRPGWDSYGARPIERNAVNAALDLLGSFMQDTTPTPSVVPLPDGGVQLEWHAGGVDLEITVHAAGGADVSCEGRGEPGWEGEISTVRPRLHSVIDRLSR